MLKIPASKEKRAYIVQVFPARVVARAWLFLYVHLGSDRLAVSASKLLFYLFQGGGSSGSAPLRLSVLSARAFSESRVSHIQTATLPSSSTVLVWVRSFCVCRPFEATILRLRLIFLSYLSLPSVCGVCLFVL